MTITASNDSVTYKSARGDTERPADLVVTVQSNGSGGFIDPTLPASVVGNVADGAVDTGNAVKMGAIVAPASLPAIGGSNRISLYATTGGVLWTSLSGNLAAGSDGALNSGLIFPGASTGGGNIGSTRTGLAVCDIIFNGTSWDRLTKPNAASRIASAAASVNATSAKGSAGNVFRVFGNNAKASIIYLKIYNKATAPTVGTDTPVLTIPLAASSRFDIDVGGSNGFYLGTGIGYGFTTDAADNGTTALLAADILGFTLTYA